jgi:hypothetical protein
MRQRKIDFGVILGSFHDERDRGAPHCRREHSLRFFMAAMREGT